MIIGICGLIGSGKGTVADVLVQKHKFTKISFADKLKDAVSDLFGWERGLLEGVTNQSRVWREQPDEFWSNEIGKDITPRYVLQKFGTECMRQGFYDDIWVSFVKKKLIAEPNKNWVIPDVRFPNEVKMIKSINGAVWCIRRNGNPKWFDDYRFHNIIPKDVHPSEYMWARSEFDYVVENNETKEDLETAITNLLQDRPDAIPVS
jgi:hypothetical protein